MQTINLYKYQRADGGWTVSLTQPQCEYTPMYRLVADEGKVVTNGTTTASCVDVENTEGWSESNGNPNDEVEDTTAIAELMEVLA